MLYFSRKRNFLDKTNIRDLHRLGQLPRVRWVFKDLPNQFPKHVWMLVFRLFSREKWLEKSMRYMIYPRILMTDVLKSGVKKTGRPPIQHVKQNQKWKNM